MIGDDQPEQAGQRLTPIEVFYGVSLARWRSIDRQSPDNLFLDD